MTGVGPLIRRVVAVALVGIAGWFLFRTVAANWEELRGYQWQVRSGLLALSVVAHVAVLSFGVLVWSLVLRHFDAPPAGVGRLLRIWSLSNAARYIPGGIWQFLAAAQLSRGAGLPGVLALTSMVVHVLLSLIAAITVSAVVLPLGEMELGFLASLPARVVILASAVAAVHPRLINLLLSLVPRALHREVLVWRATWVQGTGLLLLACFSWLLYGAAYTLFVASLTPVDLGALLPFTAVNALSFTAGYLAVPVPGGVGIRESAMTLLLSPYLSAGVAAVVAVGARLWSIAAELLLVALGLLFHARAGNPTAGTAAADPPGAPRG
jgi:glycosyltransferase 2 family protein